jgi:hypothetical protein
MQSNIEKGPKHPIEKKKENGKKGSGGNDKKDNKNVKGGENERRNMKLPIKIFGDDHLNHQFLKMEEAQQLIKLQQQQPIVLQNSIPQVVSYTSNPQGGTSSAPLSDGYFSFVNMVNYSNLKEE